MRMKTSGARSLSWKSGERGRISQGLLIWCLIIWICAADWLTRSPNQLLFGAWQVLSLLYFHSHLSPYIIFEIKSTHFSRLWSEILYLRVSVETDDNYCERCEKQKFLLIVLRLFHFRQPISLKIFKSLFVLQEFPRINMGLNLKQLRKSATKAQIRSIDKAYSNNLFVRVFMLYLNRSIYKTYKGLVSIRKFNDSFINTPFTSEIAIARGYLHWSGAWPRYL